MKLITIISLVFCISACTTTKFSDFKECMLTSKGANDNGKCHYEVKLFDK